MDKQTLIKIIDAFGVASDEAHRPSLSCVKLEPYGASNVKLTACDGHILSELILEDKELNEAMVAASKFRGMADDSSWFIPLDALPVLKLMKKNTILPCVENAGKVEIGFPGLIVTLKTAQELQFDKYPNTDQIWPKGDAIAEISFNAELLALVAKALNTNGGKSLGVKLTIRDRLSPIVVECGADARGVVMPMRLRDEN